MKIGILKCGDMRPPLNSRWGEYPQIYQAMLDPIEPGHSYLGIDVNGGAPLGAVDAVDGWIVSGSRHGVYEDHPWIEPLKAFLRDALDTGVPVAGICFGHQILAEAMGGRAAKFDGGWGVGPMSYDAVDAPDWAGLLGTRWAGHAVHQDQVVEVPQAARVIATSAFCENAALVYGDPQAPAAISVQAHPEFGVDFMRDLFAHVLPGSVPAERLEPAQARLGRPVDNRAWGRIILDLFANRNAGV